MVRKIKRKTRRDACARFVVRKGEKKKRACGAFSDGAKEEKSGKSFQNIQKKKEKRKTDRNAAAASQLHRMYI